MHGSIVFMYSGQGAQYFQMGRQLFDEDAAFRRALEDCDAILRPLIDASLLDLLYGPEARKTDPFDRTLHTHPAIVAFSYAMTQSLLDRGVKPDLLLGYSLGEYIAAIVSGAVSLEDGLTRVAGQAKLLEARTPKAGMMAILDEPEIMSRHPNLFESAWLAGHNFPGHIVVTSFQDQLRRIDEGLRPHQVACQILPISHGFHSPLVDPIAEDCRALFDRFEPPRIPVVSCRETTTLAGFSGDHLWRVLRQPILFLETIKKLDAGGPRVYIDAGPAGTLSTFAKYAIGRDSQSTCLGCVNQFGRDRKTMDMLMRALGR